MVGLGGLQGLLLPKQFYDSMRIYKLKIFFSNCFHGREINLRAYSLHYDFRNPASCMSEAVCVIVYKPSKKALENLLGLKTMSLFTQKD